MPAISSAYLKSFPLLSALFYIQLLSWPSTMAVAYPSKNINNIIEASLVDNNINPGSQNIDRDMANIY